MKEKEVIYKEKSYLIEKNYEDWFCLAARINQVSNTISLAIESMWEEIKALNEILKTDCYTQHLENTIETLHLCMDKLYDLTEACRVNAERDNI